MTSIEMANNQHQRGPAGWWSAPPTRWAMIVVVSAAVFFWALGVSSVQRNIGFVLLVRGLTSTSQMPALAPIQPDPPPFVERARLAAAISAFRGIPTDARAEYGEALALLYAGDLDSAVAVLEPLAASHTRGGTMAKSLLGNVLFWRGDVDQALAAWTTIGEDDPALLIIAGNYLRLSGSSTAHAERWGYGTTLLEQALTLRQSPVNRLIALDGLVQGLTWQRDYAHALQFNTEAIQIQPSQPRRIVDRAQIQLTAGDLSATESTIQQVLTQYPAEPSAWAMQGAVLLARCQLAPAADAFSRALADPALPADYRLEAGIRLGLTHWYTGQSEDAIEDWERIAEAFPSVTIVQDDLAAARTGTLPRICTPMAAVGIGQ